MAQFDNSSTPKPIFKGITFLHQHPISLALKRAYNWVRALQDCWWWPYSIWAPPLLLLIYVVVFGVDIPYGDPWAAVFPHIVKFHQGTLSFADLLSLNNEHRLFFPRLIIIPLALLTHWNTKAEMLLQIGFSVATFLVIKHQVSLSWRKLALQDSKFASWLLLAISLLIFSFNQWENWLNGQQLLIAFYSFVSVSGLFLLANPDLTGGRFLLGLLCAFVAHYTIAAGLIFWGVGLLLVLLTAKGLLRKALFSLIWIVTASISTVFYFQGFQRTAEVFSLSSFFLQMPAYLLYIFTFLGSPLMTFFTAFVLGVLGVALLVFLMADLFKRRAELEFSVYLPYLALCSYVFLTALAVAFGRLGEKWWLALSPRYIGMSLWFWVGLLVLLSLRSAVGDKANAVSPLKLSWSKLASPILATVLVFALLFSALGGGLGLYLRAIPLAKARHALVSGDDSDATLSQIYPDPAYLREQLSLAEEYNLTIYR